ILNSVNNASCLIACSCATPSQPTSINGTTSVCPNVTTNYSATAVTGATSYTWTLPSGWSGTSSTNAITAVAGSMSGNVVITANNSCGSSSPQSLAVTVAVPAQPGTITGSAVVCSNTSQT